MGGGAQGSAVENSVGNTAVAWRGGHLGWGLETTWRPSEIPSKFPPPVAHGGYFLGHLPIPLPLNKNKNQDLPPTPFNPSEKKRTKHRDTDTMS